MEYYSALKRNAFESILMRWMKLEPIIQSEVSQKEKDKYYILMHIYRISKNSTEEFIYRAAMGSPFIDGKAGAQRGNWLIRDGFSFYRWESWGSGREMA